MGKRRTRLLGVNMRPQNHERLKAIAEAEGKWLSEWVRDVLFEAADQATESPQQPQQQTSSDPERGDAGWHPTE